jgi:hypothetical protein
MSSITHSSLALKLSDGNITSATFGQVASAAAPRLVQLAMKFAF